MTLSLNGFAGGGPPKGYNAGKDDAAVMDRDRGIDQIASRRPEPRERAILIGAGKPAVSDDVGDQDRDKLTGLAHSSGNPALRSPSNANCSTGLCFKSHLMERSGLRRRASAMAAFASSISPLNAWAAARLR